MILERYNALSNAQKFTLRRKYNALFGKVSKKDNLPSTSKTTFYRKINGTAYLTRAEQLFFENNLPALINSEENKAD